MKFNTLSQRGGCAWVDNACSDQPSALADYERSPAIHRRVSVEKWIHRRVATVDRKEPPMTEMLSATAARNFVGGECAAREFYTETVTVYQDAPLG